jgi:hypothetical protein
MTPLPKHARQLVNPSIFEFVSTAVAQQGGSAPRCFQCVTRHGVNASVSLKINRVVRRTLASTKLSRCHKAGRYPQAI